MSGPRSSNTYTCTCTHFRGGYKTGLSRATFYRHSPYRDAAQPTGSFSTSFQNFLDDSAGDSGSGRLGLGQESQGNTDDFNTAGDSGSGRSGLGQESQGNTADLEAEFPTSPHVLDGGTGIQNFETAGVNFPF
jgi:hypothetical protein